jgi:hypothetical protein
MIRDRNCSHKWLSKHYKGKGWIPFDGYCVVHNGGGMIGTNLQVP